MGAAHVDQPGTPMAEPGKRQDAYELLAPVYDWFTEGFDTKELLEAKSLLAELG